MYDEKSPCCRLKSTCATAILYGLAAVTTLVSPSGALAQDSCSGRVILPNDGPYTDSLDQTGAIDWWQVTLDPSGHLDWKIRSLSGGPELQVTGFCSPENCSSSCVAIYIPPGNTEYLGEWFPECVSAGTYYLQVRCIGEPGNGFYYVEALFDPCDYPGPCVDGVCPEPEPLGACCLPDESCSMVTASECSAAGGAYQGDAVQCAPDTCHDPGACCFDDESCTFVLEADCLASGGVFRGENVACSPEICLRPGACCIGDECVDGVLQQECANLGGEFWGPDSTCEGGEVDCNPSGACCVPVTHGCVNLSEADCAVASGIWQGAGTDCATFICWPFGACCLADGLCVDNVYDYQCDALGGAFQGHESQCIDVLPCPLPPGACCFSDGGCLYLSEPDCDATGGTWSGIETDCTSMDCSVGACCLGGGSCLALATVSECTATGGIWFGNGTDCDDGDLNGCPDACEGCPSDLSGDGRIGFPDLIIVLSNWGLCPMDPPCPGDVDRDGQVGFSDMLLILSNWGPCPEC